MTTTTKACGIKTTPLKTEAPVKKLVRRLVQHVKPESARVRYDVTHQRWALLDDRNQVKRHFEYGVMTQVKFTAVRVHNGGCGGVSENIGVAEGLLQEHTYGSDAGAWHNLSFNGHAFTGDDNKPIEQVERLLLMPNRRSVYK